MNRIAPSLRRMIRARACVNAWTALREANRTEAPRAIVQRDPGWRRVEPIPVTVPRQ